MNTVKACATGCWCSVELSEWFIYKHVLSCSRGASCVVEYTMGRLRDWSL